MVAMTTQMWPQLNRTRTMDGAPSHVIVLTGPRISAELLGAVLHRMSTMDIVIRGTRTLATEPYTALELTVRLGEPPDHAEAWLRATAATLSDRLDLDVCLMRAGQQRRLVAFDVDSTLIRGAGIDELGELAGLPGQVLDEMADNLRLLPGAVVTMRSLRSAGIRCGLISGGFAPIVARLARSLEADFYAANEPEIVDGRLTGQPAGPPLDRTSALRRFAELESVPMSECVSVGDGANDPDMITAAGLGVAFNAATAVRARADAVISYPRIDLVLPLLGIPVPCAAVGPLRAA